MQKTWNRTILILAAIVLVALAALFAIMFLAAIGSMYNESSFASGTDPQFKNLKERGWVPRSIPPGVTDVHEAHDLDSNYRYVTFQYTGDIDELTSVCVRREYGDAAMSQLLSLKRREWWPVEELRQKLENAEWPLFICGFDDRSSFSLTVSPKQRVYMWSERDT